MLELNPNLAWCTEISEHNGLPPRCPFASVHRCPRYYQSLSLLGEAGSTKIDPAEDQKLLARWKASDLWPVTNEQATSILGPAGNPNHFVNFCPEVTFDRFGLFACSLSDYPDELDREIGHSQLRKEDATRDDWRWSWAYVSPLHYSQCPLYSPLVHDSSKGTLGLKPVEQPSESILQVKPNFHGISLNVNVLWKRLIGWWRRRGAKP